MYLLAVALVAAPVTLEADPAHSSASFSVKHMMVSNVRGEFSKLQSTLLWNKEEPTKSTVEAKLDAASIDTHNEKRDGHLKSPDFFDAAKCPEITFKSTKIEKGSAEGKYKVLGNLTMRCVTKPVTLDADVPGKGFKTPWGTTSYGASAETTIKRSDFGLTYNAALEGGGVVVSDDVKINLDLEYVEKSAAPKAEAKGATTKK
jgi:polyisoprenoid-binding protein YceI